MSCLKHLVIENFKSYVGTMKIGPLQPFTAIIGPNGSGKSNFMDAICFVMGERTQNLRVRKVEELVHGATLGRPVSDRTSVTAVFYLDKEKETEISFKRSIRNASSEYQVDGVVVNKEAYLNELLRININIKAKNFLVYQGAVESISIKSPKELTAMFEEISGSSELKHEYEELQMELTDVRNETLNVWDQKRMINSDKIRATLEIRESNNYKSLQKRLNELKLKMYLFRLYHQTAEIENLTQELDTARNELTVASDNKTRLTRELEMKRKTKAGIVWKVAPLEQELREADVERSKIKAKLIETKESVKHSERKFENCRKSWDGAKQKLDVHNAEIRHLENLLRETQAKLDGELESQSSEMQLDDKQVYQYDQLKLQSLKTNVIALQKLDSLNREQKNDQDALDNYKNLVEMADESKRLEDLRKNKLTESRELLTENISSHEEKLRQSRKRRDELQFCVSSSKLRAEEITLRLNELAELLTDVQFDNNQLIRKHKKQQVLDKLKSTHAGVLGRLMTLCKPKHQRYKLAVTKVFGRNMDAIVVDKELTARNCVKYLKEQRIEPEIFLPLDYIKAKKPSDRLRNVADTADSKLLFDVISFDPPEVWKAVQFACKNAIVCGNVEDATRFAYDMEIRNNAVTFDGIFYMKSGLISGGSTELAQKAKRWEDGVVDKIIEERNKLQTELKEVLKEVRRELELDAANAEVSGKEYRLKYLRFDLKRVIDELESEKRESDQRIKEINIMRPSIIKLERGMSLREKEINKLQNAADKVEDEVFKKFCQKIGVENIRVFERSGMRVWEELRKKRNDIQRQIDRINASLEFERSKDVVVNVERWKTACGKAQKQLETYKQLLDERSLELTNFNESFSEIEKRKAQQLKHLDEAEKEITRLKLEIKTAKETEGVSLKETIDCENLIERKLSEKHDIFLLCKIEDLNLPLLRGSMDDIGLSEDDSADENSQSTHQRKTEGKLSVDFTTLSDKYKQCEGNNIKIELEQITGRVKAADELLNKMSAPNLKASSKLDGIKDNLMQVTQKFTELRERNRKTVAAFAKIKQNRVERFNKCFQHVSSEIDKIYKKLTENSASQAILTAHNIEDPYLDGIIYNCVAPGKRVQQMSNLSGGEQSVAALALVFALHSYRPPPFVLLDEVDAALDNTNIRKVAEYIMNEKENLQAIVISLKEDFFSCADGLIGVYPGAGNTLISKVARVDLSEYP